MRSGIRLRLATGEICKALVLAVVPTAIVIPGSVATLSQNASGLQAPMFTAIDLTPNGFTESGAGGISQGQQVGSGTGPATGFKRHALLWRSSAASVVDLNPSGFDESEATGVCGGQQVGSGSGPATGNATHALMWRGSAAGVVDLNPRGFDGSEIRGTSGEQFVGDGGGPATGGKIHALSWPRTAPNVVDLHPHRFNYSRALGVSSGQQVGFGELPATGPYTNEHALLWRGSAASMVDLHPRGFIISWAYGVSGGQQVGYGVQEVVNGTQTTVGESRALLWRGSAASVVDLTPRGFGSSEAYGTNGEEQVGRAGGHAMLWRGSAASVVDLHSFLPPGFPVSVAVSIDANGDIVGTASTSAGPGGDDHAFLWKRNMPKPTTSREQNTTGC